MPDQTLPAVRSPLTAFHARTVALGDFEAVSIDGSIVPLATLVGRVVLVVNTASACGFTPQFAGLEALWQRYQERGLTVVGFPSNEFGAQDPGSNSEISAFCQKNYGVSFPMMAKVEVNGDDAHPLFQWLKVNAPGILGSERIKWNFTKFLVGRDGRVITRYAPNTTPDAIAADIESALGS
ncbi:MAG: glutathione peroxidase [Gemmatimonadaceae bacterium]|nr:glutathione peroxidase [Gemmatimonadaceae bacterium]